MVKYGILLGILIEFTASAQVVPINYCDSLIQKAATEINLCRYDSVIAHTNAVQHCNNDSLIALSYYYRACAYLEIDSIGSSLSSFELALKSSESSNNKPIYIRALLGRGLLLVKVNDFVTAELTIKEALKASVAIQDSHSIAISYERLGKLHFVLSNYQESYQFYKESNNIARATRDTMLIANSLQNLSAALVGLEDYDLAETSIKEGIEFYKLIDDIYLVSEGYRNLLHIYSDQLKLKEAQATIHEYLEYTDNTDVILNAELINEIVEIQSAVKKVENQSNAHIIRILSGILLLMVFGFYLNWRFLNRLLVDQPDLMELQSLVDRVQPFLDNDEKHKAMTYVLLSIKMSPEEIGGILYRDRSTIQHWMREMRETLGVIDVRADAIMHGSSVTYNDSVKRFLIKLSKPEYNPEWRNYLRRLINKSYS